MSEFLENQYLDNDGVDELSGVIKTYVDAGLNTKQDTLTAGTGITIDSNNVISSSIDTSNLVNLSTETQTFAGAKNFTIGAQPISFLNNSYGVILHGIDNSAPASGTATVEIKQGINSTLLGDRKIYIKSLLSGNKTITIPEKSGTLALTSDIPDVSTKANESIVADAYDNTQTYAVDDIVIYNNTLYKCTTAVMTPEDFDSTKWTATTLEELIPTNAVTLDTTEQSFAGNKTFELLSGSTINFYQPNTTRGVRIRTGLIPAITINPTNGSGTTQYRAADIYTLNDKTLSFPNKNGTLALTSDIPTALTNNEIDTIMDAILV